MAAVKEGPSSVAKPHLIRIAKHAHKGVQAAITIQVADRNALGLAKTHVLSNRAKVTRSVVAPQQVCLRLGTTVSNKSVDVIIAIQVAQRHVVAQPVAQSLSAVRERARTIVPPDLALSTLQFIGAGQEQIAIAVTIQVRQFDTRDDRCRQGLAAIGETA